MIKQICLIAGSSLLMTTAFAQKNITLTGTIANLPNGTFTVINQTNNSPQPTFSKDVKTDATGKFSVEIPTETMLNTVQIIKDRNGVEMLLPSKSKLDVSIDFNNNTPLQINENKGNEGIVVNRSFALEYKALVDKLQQINVSNTQELDSQLSTFLKDANAKVDSAFNSKTSKVYNDYYKTALVYQVKTVKMTAFNNPKMMATAEAKNQVISYVLGLKPEYNDAFVYHPVYQNYISNQPLVNDFLAESLVNPSSNLSAPLVKKAIQKAKSTMPALSASYSAANMVTLVNSSFTPQEQQSNWETVAKTFNDENGKYATAKLEDFTKFNAGKKAIDFEFTTREGEKKKLSDYKGKVVYLDFWASWCGPCRQQMPAAKELKKYYEGKDVVFLYVSIDKDVASWENGIKSMGIEGVHALSETWSGAIPKKYNISSIPAYFLIDKDGNFAERPARPSQQDEVKKQIDALLEK